ncbi:MAG: hypothetical protein WCD37_03660 [Chloroflexia bacterium]
MAEETARKHRATIYDAKYNQIATCNLPIGPDEGVPELINEGVRFLRWCRSVGVGTGVNLKLALGSVGGFNDVEVTLNIDDPTYKDEEPAF